MKSKKQTKQARVVGPVPSFVADGIYWKVRLAVPRLPFFLDSHLSFTDIEDAKKFADSWRSKKVTVVWQTMLRKREKGKGK